MPIRCSTWFTAVLGELPDGLFDIRIEDQDHSARLLREGAVMGAVTTERNPVPGCRVQSLGLMRYVPVAGPDYVERYLSEGFTVDTVRAAPSLAWNRDDGLQDMLVRKAFRRKIPRLVHFVPTADGFGSAVRASLAGACTQSSWQQRRWLTVRSSVSPMCISMCRCIGSAGNSTAESSMPSPAPWSWPPPACRGAVSSWPAMSSAVQRGPNIIVRRHHLFWRR